MPALALAEALPDFGAGFTAPNVCAEMDGPPSLTIAAENATNAMSPSEENDAAIEEAVAEAEAALRERLEQEHAAALAAERQRLQTQLDAANESLGGKAAILVSERLAETEASLLALTGSLAARILGTALTEDLQQRAIDELERVISAALADREAVRIRISGAAHLFEPLKAALGDKADQLEFSESDALDLTVAIDEELFETRLSEWTSTLTDVLA